MKHIDSYLSTEMKYIIEGYHECNVDSILETGEGMDALSKDNLREMLAERIQELCDDVDAGHYDEVIFTRRNLSAPCR